MIPTRRVAFVVELHGLPGDTDAVVRALQQIAGVDGVWTLDDVDGPHTVELGAIEGPRRPAGVSASLRRRFEVEHPLACRLQPGGLAACELTAWLREHAVDVEVAPGRYTVTPHEPDAYSEDLGAGPYDFDRAA